MNWDALFDLFRAVVLTLVLLKSIRLIARKKYSVQLAFFTLGIACILFSDYYWFVYDILRSGERMPAAANEVVEWAMFLLLGAALTRGQPIRFCEAKWEIVGAAFFAAVNAALWIGWSGEWIQDILTGAVYGYYLCALVCRIKEENAFTPRQRQYLRLTAFILILAQTGTFLTPKPISKALDLFCYVLLFAAAAFLVIRTFASLKNADSSGQSICYAFTAFAWGVTTLYMSAGIYYLSAMALSRLCFVLMLLALEKEVAA